MLGEDALEIDHERLLSGLGDRIDGAFGPVALASDVVDLDQSVPEKPVDRVVERARPKLHQPILTSLERDLHHLVRVQRLFGEQPEHQHRQRSQHMLTPTATAPTTPTFRPTPIFHVEYTPGVFGANVVSAD